LIEDGGKVVQETRLYDPDKDETRSMRSKEDAMDYRYFPDPDLLPLAITPQWIDDVRAMMPELPLQKRYRFMASNVEMYQTLLMQQSLINSDADLDVQMDRTLRQAYKQVFHGFGEQVAAALTVSRAMSEYFEELVGYLPAGNSLTAANWLLGEVSAFLNRHEMEIVDSPVSPKSLAKLIERSIDGTLNNKMAKEVFAAMWAGEGDADTIIEKRGLKQISDSGEIEKIVDQVLAANAKSVEEFRAGKEKAFNALVGQVMKATKGKANPAQVNDLLKKQLG
jgi:aspartyl-tRNA(Asn)/glutamyl-tRNA(Gln) amidotransferase subunit B